MASSRTMRATREPLVRLTDAQLAVATPAEVAAYENALRLELACTSPLEFAQYVSPWFESQPHLALLDDLIVRLVSDQLRHPKTGKVVRRLAVSMPPRHGKSELISTHTPAWALATHPDWRVILSSYEATFAASWGKKARAIIEEHPEFGVPIDPSSRASDKWDLDSPHRGGMLTAGVGGGVTGKGAHLFIIDDPVKNADEARSETFRARNKDWYTTTARTRLEPNSYIIVLQTRWHEDDLLGWLLSDQPDRWYSLNLPALAVDDDPLGREPGGALCPDWYDDEALADIAVEVGVPTFSALYQGSPTTRGGGIFIEDNFRTWRTSGDGRYYVLDGGRYVRKDDCVRFATVDLGATDKTTADFSVFSVWDATPDRDLLLVGRERKRILSADHVKWATAHYRTWKPSYVLVEKVTFGLTLLQAGVRDGLPLRPAAADKDKTSRALVAGALVDGGRAYFPPIEVAPWIGEWNSELTGFPNAAHDDQVDTFAYAAREVTTGALSAVKRRKWEEKTDLQSRVQRHAEAKRRLKRRRHPILGKL